MMQARWIESLAIGDRQPAGLSPPWRSGLSVGLKVQTLSSQQLFPQTTSPPSLRAFQELLHYHTLRCG